MNKNVSMHVVEFSVQKSLPLHPSSFDFVTSCPHRFPCAAGLPTTATAAMTRSRKDCHTFPGDPRYGTTYHPLREHVDALASKDMLNVHLLDALLQRAAMPPKESNTEGQICHLGNCSTLEYLENSNAHFVDLEHEQADHNAVEVGRLRAKIQKTRMKLYKVFRMDTDIVNRLIIPIIDTSHFFVLVVDFNPTSPNFYQSISFYDSLRRSTRGSRGVDSGSRMAPIVCELNDFFVNYLLYKPEHKPVVLSDDEVLRKVEYHDCPGQLNGIDCGLFCVGVVLHLLDGIEVDRNTFTHRHCSRLRMKLSTHFTHVVHNREDEDAMSIPTGQVVRDSYPLLQGTSIVGGGGVEDVTPHHFLADMSLAATTLTTTRSMAAAAASVGDRDDSDIEVLEELSSKRRGRQQGRRNAERDRIAFAEKERDRRVMLELKRAMQRISSTSTHNADQDGATTLLKKGGKNYGRPRKPRVLSDIESDDGEGDTGRQVSDPEGSVDSTDDQLLQHLLRKRGEESFQSLADIDPLIAEYKRVSGNDLKLKKTIPNSFRLYVCKGHAKCPYQIFVGKRPDGTFAVKRIVSQHHGHPNIPLVASRQGGKKSSRNEADEETTSNGSDDEYKSDEGSTDDDDEDEDAGTVDNIFTDLLKEQTVHAYPCMEDFNPIVEEYERKSGNHIAVVRSERSVYRHYKCKEHVNCCFEIIIGRRRGDGMFAVKKIVGKHSGERRGALARGGRLWKKRRAGKLDNMIVQVLRTKEQKPTPADIVKTAATQMGEVVPYMSAYRALKSDTREQRLMQTKNFQLLIPYLEALKKANEGSVIGSSRDSEKHVTEVHVFPGFMNHALSFVRPVVSVDAAHLKGVHKGTMYVASVMSGANDVYPVGFMLAKGNEDGATWTYFLTLLKEACPILYTQGFPDSVEGTHYPAAFLDYRHPFVFISDRDKGLQPALQAVFPRNCAVSCAKHIEANVRQR
jgi:Ulp1 protease family, C-terminal catalytic domain